MLSQRTLYALAIVLSVIVSLSGVAYSVYVSKNPVDGQRGGAIAVVVSLWILFLRRNYGERVYRAIVELSPSIEKKLEDMAENKPVTAFSDIELTIVLLGLVGRINVEADEQRVQNIALFLASVVGTMFWGFGDAIATKLLQSYFH